VRRGRDAQGGYRGAGRRRPVTFARRELRNARTSLRLSINRDQRDVPQILYVIFSR
jgi:hypothetical protein